MLTRITCLFFCVALLACNNENAPGPGEISVLDEVPMSEIYLDYRLHAEEGDDKLNIVLQFREADSDGRTLVVGEAGRVMLDDEQLQADSTARTGAYYEVQKPIETFRGTHRIRLEGPGGEALEESFQFQPMTIDNSFPGFFSRQEELVLELGGLESRDFVRLIMMDTSFYRDGINRLDTVVNGRLVISPADWGLLKSGDIHLELHRESERPVGDAGGAGGRFIQTYVLERGFILTD